MQFVLTAGSHYVRLMSVEKPRARAFYESEAVHYSMGHMPAKVFASRYLTDLPEPETLRRESGRGGR